MSFLAGLYDPSSGTLHEADPGFYIKDHALSAVYDYVALRDAIEDFGVFFEGASMKRFQSLLPLKKPLALQPDNAGTTPVRTLSRKIGKRKVRLKEAGESVGASLWDRAAAVVLTLGKEWDSEGVLLASEGPAARAVVKLITKMETNGLLLIDESTDRVSLDTSTAEPIVWSTNNKPDRQKQALKLARTYDLLLGLPGWNPYFMEGIKTVSYELFDQLNSLPKILYVGTESSFVAQAILKGFRELKTMNFCDDLPEVVQVSVAPLNGDANLEFFDEDKLKSLEKAFREDNLFRKPALRVPRRIKITLPQLKRTAEKVSSRLSNKENRLSVSSMVALTGGLIDSDRNETDHEEVVIVSNGTVPSFSKRTVTNPTSWSASHQELPEVFRSQSEPGRRPT